MKIFLLSILLVILFIFSAKAQTGCVKYYGLAGYDNVYYPTPLGGAAGTYGPRYGGPATPIPPGCTLSQPADIDTRECSLYNNLTGTYNLGGLFVQNYLMCSLDNSLPIVVFFIGLFGFVFLRKKIQCI